MQEVKEALTFGRYGFKGRDDNKNNPRFIGLDEVECIAIISNLTYDEFCGTSYHGNDEPADIYKKFGYFRKRDNIPIDLYIKFSLVKGKVGRNVLIISFHKEGEHNV